MSPCFEFLFYVSVKTRVVASNGACRYVLFVSGCYNGVEVLYRLISVVVVCDVECL